MAKSEQVRPGPCYRLVILLGAGHPKDEHMDMSRCQVIGPCRRRIIPLTRGNRRERRDDASLARPRASAAP